MLARHVVDRLAAYAEAQLEPRERTSVERHLAGCARCRATLDEVRRGLGLMRELEAEAMPADDAEAMRARLLAFAADRSAAARASTARRMPRTLWRAAAVLLLTLAGAVAYWQANRPWATLIAAEAPATAFEREGLAIHRRFVTGDAVDFATSSEADAWRWLASVHAPVTSLVPDRPMAERARFLPAGAAVRDIAGARTSVLSYRVDGRPVTLLLARAADVADAPSSGWWSKRVTYRREGSISSLTWTVSGGTYVLVSELEGFGQRACFVCHTSARFQTPILALTPRTTRP